MGTCWGYKSLVVAVKTAFEVACIGLVLTVAAGEEGRSHFAKRKRGGQIEDEMEGGEMIAVVGMWGPDIDQRSLLLDISLMEIQNYTLPIETEAVCLMKATSRDPWTCAPLDLEGARVLYRLVHLH